MAGKETERNGCEARTDSRITAKQTIKCIVTQYEHVLLIIKGILLNNHQFKCELVLLFVIDIGWIIEFHH